MNVLTDEQRSRSGTFFQGLAPFLRASIAGTDLVLVGRELLALTNQHPNHAVLLLKLSLVVQCLGQRELGLAIQEKALEIERVYTIEARHYPAQLRLLMLMMPGDIAANTPLECLFESGEIELVLYYLTPGDPLAIPVPEHDVLLVALAACDDRWNFLEGLEHALDQWPKPIVNLPKHIQATTRHLASTLLQNAPGLYSPLTVPASRTVLSQIATGDGNLGECLAGGDFPIIIRPIDSHAGRDLEKLDSPADLAAYLTRIEGLEFFVSVFVDYRSPDGLFRKYRVALIDGAPHACHMGISSNWMVHYVNAGMYEEASKRDEEASFMASFHAFARRHQAALAAIHERSQLDYLGIDCAEAPDGRLLVFEIDNCMVVHAMDPQDVFPYKHVPMQQLKTALLDYLLRVASQ